MLLRHTCVCCNCYFYTLPAPIFEGDHPGGSKSWGDMSPLSPPVVAPLLFYIGDQFIESYGFSGSLPLLFAMFWLLFALIAVNKLLVGCSSSSIRWSWCFFVVQCAYRTFLDQFTSLVRACIAKLQLTLKQYKEVDGELSVSTVTLSLPERVKKT